MGTPPDVRVAHREGLEPSTYAFVEHCYYPVELLVYELVPPSGIEPELTEYKTVSLPLTYRGYFKKDHSLIALMRIKRSPRQSAS